MSLGTACQAPEPHTAEFFVFGTVVEVTVPGGSARDASMAFAALQADFMRMHRDWHPWEPGLLMDINTAFERGEEVTADEDLVTLLRAAQTYERLTGGRFNAAIGHLVELWGFHTSDYPITGPLPAAADIEALVAKRPSALDIDIRNGALFDRSRNVRLDFSGIAKGLAVDRACALLSERGVGNALVAAGGDLRGCGRRTDRRWRIAVRNPLGGVIGIVELQEGEAAFTSGNYERFREGRNEARYAHILDPDTGWPAADVMSATVIAKDAMRADAAATALVVAGLNNWREVAGPLELAEILLTDEQGRVYGTPQMLNRIELDQGTVATLLGPE